jgi:hypothetical protein
MLGVISEHEIPVEKADHILNSCPSMPHPDDHQPEENACARLPEGEDAEEDIHTKVAGRRSTLDIAGVSSVSSPEMSDANDETYEPTG